MSFGEKEKSDQVSLETSYAMVFKKKERKKLFAQLSFLLY